jgi:hypothetical protein
VTKLISLGSSCHQVVITLISLGSTFRSGSSAKLVKPAQAHPGYRHDGLGVLTPKLTHLHAQASPSQPKPAQASPSQPKPAQASPSQPKPAQTIPRQPKLLPNNTPSAVASTCLLQGCSEGFLALAWGLVLAGTLCGTTKISKIYHLILSAPCKIGPMTSACHQLVMPCHTL